jgi:hypothetical protein
MISWHRNIGNPHACIKSSSYRCRINFFIWNYMDCFYFFLLINSFKNNIRIITIFWRIFKVKKFEFFLKIMMVIHGKWKMTHFTSNNSPLVWISWVSWSSFSFWIYPHSNAVYMYKTHWAWTFAWTYKWVFFLVFFLILQTNSADRQWFSTQCLFFHLSFINFIYLYFIIKLFIFFNLMNFLIYTLFNIN